MRLWVWVWPTSSSAREKPPWPAICSSPCGEKKGSRPTAVDVFTTVLTTTGVATSFGMGCLQISEGLNFLFGIPNNVVTWIVIIVAICAVYLLSAISGVGKGIKKLSDLNLVFFVILMALAFLVGPMGDTLKLGLEGLGSYLLHFFPDSLRMSAQGDRTWIEQWRVFYWAWWLG